ncbi:MAG TPA: hypothetical protein VK191_11430 [Symbiobacteriaceae bacterium]|nr:hypothetical protein [Symbiobacteriaceae bacterium]
MRRESRWLLAVVLLAGVLSGCAGVTSKSTEPQGSGRIGSTPQKAAGQPAATRQESPYGFSWGEYGLGIPGASFQIDNGDTVTQVTGSGAQTASTLKLNADGTYVWNSQWDGKTYKGQWQKGSGDYPITIPGAQEGKTWHVGKEKDGDIYVYDGNSIYYIGKWVRP